MGIGISWEQKNGCLYMSGHIDEHVNWDPVLQSKEPVIKLNLRRVAGINSLGLRSLVGMSKATLNATIEFYDCPPVFIEAVNVMPLVVGGQNKVTRIKSVFLPMACSGDHHFNVAVMMSSINFSKSTPVLPKTSCPTCSMPLLLDMDMDPGDLFFFVYAANGDE